VSGVELAQSVRSSPFASTRVATVADRGIALILALGVVSVVLAALSWKVFELDRYFVPKELVLNVVALVIGLSLIPRRRLLRLDAVDLLLILFLSWSAISALIAGNHWIAQRAFGVSLSSALVFWGARRAGTAGMQRVLFGAAAIAVVVAAMTSLAQAYGVRTDWFTLARAPGGTLGNRNFIAHVVAIGLPATIWCTIAARSRVVAFAGTLSIGLLAATLILSRSRAAWLAVASFVAVGAVLLLISRKYWKGGVVGGRLARLLLSAVTCVGLAVVLPNSLEWKSDSPYLDSARNVVDYSSGSGRGRVAQYRNSLRMARENPIFGVGPGNWAVRYPPTAPEGDKSLADNGMTANPWPSSDWMAFLSERGVVAAAALLGVFVVLFFRALRRWRGLEDSSAVLTRVAVAATVVSTIVVSAFDAVLLLPAPAFLVWLILGSAGGERRGGREITLSKKAWSLAAAALIFVSLTNAARSAAQAKAMSSVATGGNRAGWIEGARWDPGSYRINQRVAELYAARGQCGKAQPYARRALGLFPSSPAARRTARRCGMKL
jgi:O-antigen ligase